MNDKVKNRRSFTILKEMAPKCETCRLVATVNKEEEIHLTVLHKEDGFVYFKLKDIDKQREDIQVYIKELQPKIETGEFQVGLVDMEKELVCS
ncbi:hypothetical protein [Gracilibacillus sp. YIM 98692]|uniref:hypothetical protein n=1 Tax=Gracilibacillus sp. YIM 98692 TaxID=2663532 RepID=UPI0013D147D7|nr:hypothetical protein [Gracilibacillus sp. YIM 98692]